MVTRRDYELTALIIKNQRAALEFTIAIANRFADAYERDNVRFDRALFMRACGV